MFYVFPFPLHTISFLHTLSLPQLDCLSPPMQGSFVHSHYTVTRSLSLSLTLVSRNEKSEVVTEQQLTDYLTEQSNVTTDVQVSHCTVQLDQLDQLDQGTAAISLSSPT
jgi:hypothetical protein